MTAYWDSVAHLYLRLFRDELNAKPFDIDTLRAFATGLGAGAKVCDIGCGPCAHVAALLAAQGAQVEGIDYSPACVALARAERPELRFTVMDIRAMTFADCAFDGLVAYYALHYMPKDELDGALSGMRRILRPGGRLLVVAKEGASEGFIDDPLGTGQRVFWCATPAADLAARIASAGFEIEACTVREALPGEFPVRRIYVQARRPVLE